MEVTGTRVGVRVDETAGGRVGTRVVMTAGDRVGVRVEALHVDRITKVLDCTTPVYGDPWPSSRARATFHDPTSIVLKYVTVALKIPVVSVQLRVPQVQIQRIPNGEGSELRVTSGL